MKRTGGVAEFGSGEALFKLQCKYGSTEIEPGRAVVALVMEVSRRPDGRQFCLLKVASTDGGFPTMASTRGDGEDIRVGDCIMWVPKTKAPEVFEQFKFGDPRSDWLGVIRAVIEPTVGLHPDAEWIFRARFD